MQEFIDQIKKNLVSNGFPDKKVSLPTEKMYEIADKKGFSLNLVLEKMKVDDQILFEIGDDKIIFSKIVVNESNFPNINPEMFSKVEQMLSKMDPSELEKLQEEVSNMSEEEREQMLAKAKGMGFF